LKSTAQFNRRDAAKKTEQSHFFPISMSLHRLAVRSGWCKQLQSGSSSINAVDAGSPWNSIPNFQRKNVMQSITKKFVNIALALSLLAAFVCALSLSSSSPVTVFVAPKASAAAAVNAVDISFCNERGQQIGEGRPFPLDRVARGEYYTVIVRAQQYPICIQQRAANGYFRQWVSHGEFRHTERVSTNPSFDNVTFTVLTLDGRRLAQRRLPIGRK
jgi:hypothetical protein